MVIAPGKRYAFILAYLLGEGSQYLKYEMCFSNRMWENYCSPCRSSSTTVHVRLWVPSMQSHLVVCLMRCLHERCLEGK